MRGPNRLSRSSNTMQIPLAALMLTLLLALNPRAQAGENHITLYLGQLTEANLSDELLLLKLGTVDMRRAYLAGVGYGHLLARPLDALRLEIEGFIGRHFGTQHHTELVTSIVARWTSPPWDALLSMPTTLAIGEGLSLTSRVPELEEELHPRAGSRKLLNYLALEATLSPSSMPGWSVVARIHHRSGVFGLFGGVRGASNILTLGLRRRL